MGGHRERRRRIALPRPSLSRRLLELGKDAVILLLVCSAVYLTARSRLYNTVGSSSVLSGLSSLLYGSPSTPLPEDVPAAPAGLVQPVRLAVTLPSQGAVQRCASQYNTAQTDRDFAAVSSFFSEALASAQAPVPITEEEWQTALSSPGIYLDMLGEMPLPLLRQWLGARQEQAGAPEDSARYLVLACPDRQGSAALYYRSASDGAYYACETSVTYENYLSPALAKFEDNGARFAFELPPEDYGRLAPEVLLLQTPPQPIYYTVSVPLSLADDGDRAELERALRFYTADYPSGGDWVARESDILRISPTGLVTYESGPLSAPPRYPVEPGPLSLIEEAQSLAAKALSVWQAGLPNPGRLYLSRLEPVGEDGWQATFQYSLDGAEVLLPDGPAARFTAENGRITSFQLNLRCYESSGSSVMLLRELQAAAALGALEPDGKAMELALFYEDNGTKALPGWAVRR